MFGSYIRLLQKKSNNMERGEGLSNNHDDIKKKMVRETTRLERIAYGSYFSGQNIIYYLIQTYLVVYYVSGLGMSPALIAGILLAARVWDAINDPLIGILMDRIRFRGAQHKGWLNIATFLVPLATLALYLVPADAEQWVKIAYMIISYLVWDVLYTASEVPIFAVSTSMTKNERERTLLLTLTQIGSVLGVVFATVVMDQLIGEGVDNINWFLAGLIPAAAALLLMLPQNFFVVERHGGKSAETLPLIEMLRHVLRNDQHFWMMLFYVSQLFLNAVSVFGIFVAEAYYGNPRLVTFTSLFSLAGILLLGGFTPWIVRRFGKKRYLEFMMLATIALSVPVFFIPAENWVLAMLFLGLRTMTLVVTSLLRPMFTADCIEYGAYKTGTRNESTAFAIQTFFNKTGDALGSALGAFILVLVSFNEVLSLAEQAAGTIDRLQFWYVLLPMLMAAVMYIGPKLVYHIDEKTVAGYIETGVWQAERK